jgi:hypothetical protein
MNERTKRLRDLMAKHKLTSSKVGKILNRSAHTVSVWKCAWDGRAIPDHALELLEIRLAEGNACV